LPFDPDHAANVLRDLAESRVSVTIALGAGLRTADALSADPDAARRAIDAVVDDDPDRVGKVIASFTVQAPCALAATNVRRVLICSEMFERELTQRARELFGDSVEIITAFDRSASLPSTLSAAQQAVCDQWNSPNDREALWLSADRLMNELHAQLERTSEWRYGTQRQLNEFREFCSALGGIEHLRHRAILNAGCGRYHPLGQSVLGLLAGASRCVALDIEQPLDPARSARATAELIAHALLDPSPFGATRSELLQRIESHIDLAALQRGDLASALRSSDMLAHHLGDIAESSAVPAAQAFDFIISRDVFEHLHNVPAALSAMRDRLNPAGMLIAWIDCSDHRRYTNPRTFSHWGSLTHEGAAATKSTGDINGLRFPHYAALFADAGFETLQFEPTETEPIPAHVRTQLAPMYREMTDADLAVCRAIAVLRRPAHAPAVRPARQPERVHP